MSGSSSSQRRSEFTCKRCGKVCWRFWLKRGRQSLSGLADLVLAAISVSWLQVKGVFQRATETLSVGWVRRRAKSSSPTLQLRQRQPSSVASLTQRNLTASHRNGRCGNLLLDWDFGIETLLGHFTHQDLRITPSTHVSAFIAKFASDKFAVSVMHPPKSNSLRR